MNRKMVSLLLLVATGLLVKPVMAVTDIKQDVKSHQRFGVVSLQGSILEPTCTISAGSREQVISLNTVSIPTLVVEGQGPIEYFSIRLTECSLVDQKGTQAERPRFTATFEGPAQNGLFQLFGDAKGASLAIADRYGRSAIPGKPLPPVDIDTKSLSLLYQARLVKNNDIPRAGNYQATLRFKLEYY
ncbi:fimbrial protein [Proteus vulgaris]|uniref:fimbrial protein n=1 Tax=Proteus vulgaris TaxID=585 RepID=UPI0028BEF545|nr:fimbrial protein [Proteus vulgaris]